MLPFRHVPTLLLSILSLGFLGCDQRLRTSDPTNPYTQEASGGVAFRVNAADLAGFGVVVDSIRVEAERTGFPTRAATGGLQKMVELPDLAGGTWTLKVALYDVHGQIQLYGDAVVEVVPGRTVEATVRLRRASGSVRVRIILDDTLPTGGIDTLHPQWGANTPTWKPVASWRTADGIFLVSGLQEPCVTPYITFPERTATFESPALARSALFMYIPSQLVLGSKTDSGMVCDMQYRERIKFIPWRSTGTVTLFVPGDSIVLDEPILPPPVVDTLEREISLSQDTSLVPLPILRAFRSDSGIHILTTRSDVSIPRIVQVPDSGTLLKFGADPRVLLKLAMDYRGNPIQVDVTEWEFLRWNACGMVRLRDVAGSTWTFNGSPCPDIPATDTVVVQPIQAPANYEFLEKLPVLGAWRDERGVYISTRYDCNAPPQVVETDMFTMSSGVVRFTPVRSGLRTKIGCGDAKHVLFVPTTYNGPHQVYDGTTNTYIDLPGVVVPIKDTAAVIYRLGILRSDSVRVDYELTMDGSLSRTITTPLQVMSAVLPLDIEPVAKSSEKVLSGAASEVVVGADTQNAVSWAPLPQVGSSTQREMILVGSLLRDSIQKILDLRAIRSLPAGQCVPPKVLYRDDPRPADIWAVGESVASDAKMIIARPWYLSYRRSVGYADGKTVSVDLVASQCSTTTDLLSEVDDILIGLLPPYGN